MNLKIILSLAIISIFVISSADAHIAKDEVPRHGSQGFSLEQDNHSHPHNRIIWYQPETANYTGSAADLYEMQLTNYTVAPPPAEIVIVENVLERDIPQVVVFDLHDGVITCPDGKTNDKLKLTSPHIESHFIWSSESTYHLAELYTKDSNNETYLSVFWGNVDQITNTYHLIGIIESSIYDTCRHTPNSIFPVDVRGDCDGTWFSITSRHESGFNATATGDQIRAACLP